MNRLPRPQKPLSQPSPTGGRGKRLRALGVVLAAAAISIVVAACGNIRTGDAEVYGLARFKLPALPKTGSHAVLLFNEMHYQPSYKSQEGPRLLPHPDAVPVTGRELRYESLEEYGALKIPQRVLDSYDASHVAELFRVNCVVCHGASMTGDGSMGTMMKEKALAPLPANLMLPLTQASSTEGEIFAFISNGGRQGYALIERGKESNSPMPEFRLLLTEDERWTLVKYLLDQ